MKQVKKLMVAAGVCSALALGTTSCQKADGLTIVRRGSAADVIIALPENPSATQAYAASEIRDYVQKATGVELAVVTNAPAGGKAIRLATIEDPELGPDGFRLSCNADELTIAASDKAGALYGAYEFLERFVGVHWYSPECERVPQKETVSVPSDFTYSAKPDFEMRSTSWASIANYGDFAARCRINANAPLAEKHGGTPYRFGRGLWACHTFDTLLSPKKYFKDHPEYWGERDGKRDGGNQLCMTNPDVLKLMTESLSERIRLDPGAKFYGVSQMDHTNYCQCKNCAAVDADEESTAGSTMRFMNALAENIEKEFPDVLIETLAYQYTRFPTKKAKLRKNVVPCICSIECDFGIPLAEAKDGMNKIFADCLKGWAEQTEKLYIWDYTVDFKDYLHYFPNFKVLQKNVQFFRDSKVRFLFEQGSGARHAFMGDMKAWLLAKWMWNADQPMEPLVDEFLQGYYGEGAPYVKEFLTRLDQENDAFRAKNPDYTLWIYEESTTNVYSDAFVEWSYAQFDKAAQATVADPVSHSNVLATALCASYERFVRNQTPENAKDFVARGKHVAGWQFSEGGPRDVEWKLKLENLDPTPKPWAVPGWDLVWHDEFNGRGIDSRNWKYEKGFVRNQELQYYTKDRKENCRIEDGCLVLEARKEDYTDPETGAKAAYTSASLESSWRFSLMYGRIDVRAKVPAGKGVWPAAWTLGANIDEVSWPHCGEIDIMEYVGHEPNTVWGTLHWSDKRSKDANLHMSKGAKKVFDKPLADDFHVFSMEWNEKLVTISVDGEKYCELDTTTIDSATTSWPPFNQYHYMLLNLAYGGTWGGQQGVDDTCLPAKYLVDWVRVYKPAKR